ncbi:serine/threonine-protein kinase [Synechocystis sp. LKSZ1]|uniref:serine/threonine-protein kinase n=1 Tax=Synechocystis sp. LKSZ1 TaxID=3144951 RepID=UPI00336BEB96
MASPWNVLPRPQQSRSHYRILGQIGQGQFGRVYCAVHRTTGKLYALKDLEHGVFPTNRFLRELSYLVTLRHPRIVACYALEYHRTGRYLVMEYCAGGTLRDLLEQEGDIPLGHKLQLIQDILSALDHAHRKNIIHCDIKPENILLVPTAEGWQAKITDFGIAQLAAVTGNPNFGKGYTGSPAYMAPERFYGKVSSVSDLYAVGVLFYELLAGERPFSGRPGELQTAHLNYRLQFPPNFPPLLVPIVAQALEKLPQKRFSSAQAMLEAVQSISRQVSQSSTGELSGFFNTVPITSPYPVQVTQSDPLAFPVRHLAVVNTKVYLALKNQLSCWRYPGEDLQGAYEPAWEVGLDTAIIGFQVNDRGLNVVGQALPLMAPGSSQRYCFYQFPETLALNRRSPQAQVCWSAERLLWSLDPQGQWLACIKSREPLPQSGKGYFQVWNLCQGKSLGTPHGTLLPSQLITLDHRHGLLVLLIKTGQRQSTLVQLFNRRGQVMSAFSLAFLLSALTFNPCSRNHLFGLDLREPTTAVLVRLQPLKVTRFALDFKPQFILPFAWGYLLADTQGQVLLLNHEGFRIGHFELGATLTALAPVGRLGCLAATWEGNQGSLQHIDLGQELDERIQALWDAR